MILFHPPILYFFHLVNIENSFYTNEIFLCKIFDIRNQYDRNNTHEKKRNYSFEAP